MSWRVDRIFLSEDFNSDGEENTEVIVILKSGEKYTSSFFSYENIQVTKNRNKKTGDFLNGKYFFVDKMILVEDCELETIKNVIHHLIEEGDFQIAFRRIDT